MDLKTTAVVFQGLQNDFCHPSGALYGALREQLEQRRFIDNMLAFLTAAAALGVKCYFVPIVFTPDYRELRNPEGILALIKEKQAFRKNSPGAEPINELKPLLKYIRVLEPKRGLCAFGGTDLGDILKEDGIETVAVCGLLTNLCLESTARTAYDRGYKIILLNDCASAKSAEEQRASEQFVFPLLGQVMAFRDFLAKLKQKEQMDRAENP